jgi:hypothetical protein
VRRGDGKTKTAAAPEGEESALEQAFALMSLARKVRLGGREAALYEGQWLQDAAGLTETVGG